MLLKHTIADEKQATNQYRTTTKVVKKVAGLSTLHNTYMYMYMDFYHYPAILTAVPADFHERCCGY